VAVEDVLASRAQHPSGPMSNQARRFASRSYFHLLPSCHVVSSSPCVHPDDHGEGEPG
jgi:hypothetical protein